MTAREPRLSKEEHTRLGREWYEREIRAKVEAGNHGRIVAIDVDSGAFELGDDVLATGERLLSQHPDAQIWFERIGHLGVHRFGMSAIAARC